MKQTGWRNFLSWGCVIAFLFVIPTIFLLQLLGLGEHMIGKAGYMREWMLSVTGILISLASLKTYQQVKENNQNNDKEKKE